MDCLAAARRGLGKALFAIIILGLVSLSELSLAEVPRVKGGHKRSLSLAPVSFASLPGWTKDNHWEALQSFLRSCEKLAIQDPGKQISRQSYAGRIRDWLVPCRYAISRVENLSDDISLLRKKRIAKRFFEGEFRAFKLRAGRRSQAKFTGYYVQPLRASRRRHGPYQFPLYKRPEDLISLPLDEFLADGHGRRLWGRVNERQILPYWTRDELWDRQGGWDREVLLWVDSPADAVQVEIEGSGRAVLDSGEILMVAFAGKNGRKSGMLGTIARKMRLLSAAHREGAWSEAELNRYRELIAKKTSVVFFKIEDRAGAIGSQDVELSPGRSLAVDRGYFPMSLPMWIDTKAPQSLAGGKVKIKPYRRLLIAQDTGGAILGPLRGDIYFGADKEALDLGKRMRSRGRMWILLPKGLSPQP